MKKPNKVICFFIAFFLIFLLSCNNLKASAPEACSGFRFPIDESYNYNGLTWLQPYTYSCGVVLHPGFDINVAGTSHSEDQGRTVKSVADGIIRNKGAWGTIVIEHFYNGSTYYSQYGHMQNITNKGAGQKVDKGEKIGEIGNVGTVDAHLHFEIRQQDHSNPEKADYFCELVGKSEAQIRSWYEDPAPFVINHKSYPCGEGVGYASVSSSSIYPSSVVLGQNFQVNVSLKEVKGYPKTFDKVAFAILSPDGTFAFDFAMYDNVSIGAGGTWSKTATNYIYDSRPPGTYQLMVRGNIGGGPNDWFDFDSTGSGNNPIYFSASREGSDPPDNPPDPGSGNADITIETVEVSRAGHDHFDSEVELTIGDFSKIDMEVKVKNKKSEDVYVDIYYYWDDDRDFSYSSGHLVGTDMNVKIDGDDNVTEHKRDIQIPTQPGKYYYYINVIAPGDDDHSNDSDHDEYGKITINEPTFPDLVVPTVSVDDSTLFLSQSFNISATVKNQGNGTSAASTLRYYRSTDSIISTSDTLLGTDSVSGLSANATSNQSLPSSAPSSEGTYWIGVCVDSVSGESNTKNNCSSGLIIDVRKSIPSAPTGLSAKASSLSTIDLSWIDNSNDEDGFRIDRSLNSSDWSTIATPGANAINYQDSGLSDNTTYFYRILSYNSGGNSIWSNIASAKTSISQPDRFSGLNSILLLLLNEQAIPGDLNNDGVVNILDYSIFASNYGLTNCGNIADLNGDCVVDNLDYTIMHANWTP